VVSSATFEGQPILAVPAPLEEFRMRANRDPSSAARWLAGQADLSRNPAWLEQLALAWAEKDAVGALSWVKGHPADLQPPLLLAIAGQLVSSAPHQALAIATEVHASPLRDDILSRGLAAWAEEDLPASRRWLDSLADPSLREVLQPVFVIQLSIRDPGAALRLATADLSAGRAREDTLASVFTHWAGQDPTAAMNGASALENPAERGSAIAGICSRLGQDDPSGAIRTLVDKGVAEACPDLLQEIAARWLAVEEGKAADWINLQPDGEIRDLLVKQMAIARSQSDPAEASRLLAARIPPGPVHDEAALSILRHWAVRNPRAASRWLATFPSGPFHDSAARVLEEITSRR
jgi:hypothetical protein